MIPTGNLIELASEWWLTWLFGIVGAWLIWKVKQLKAKQSAADVRQKALEEGVQALLRAEIIRSYDKYHDQGYITLHGKEAMEKAYTAYHELGGNGTITGLMESIKNMEVET